MSCWGKCCACQQGRNENCGMTGWPIRLQIESLSNVISQLYARNMKTEPYQARPIKTSARVEPLSLQGSSSTSDAILIHFGTPTFHFHLCKYRNHLSIPHRRSDSLIDYDFKVGETLFYTWAIARASRKNKRWLLIVFVSDDTWIVASNWMHQKTRGRVQQ